MGAYGVEGPLLMGITWTETCLGTICMIIRVFGAAYYTKRVEWDLFWMLITLACAISAQVMLTISANYGIGNNITALTISETVMALKFCWVAQLLIAQSIGLGKAAIVALLLQIQGRTHQKMKYLLHAVWIGNILLTNTLLTIILMLSCQPYYKLWDFMAPGNCNFLPTATKLGYLTAAWAVASDFILATYPIIVFWSLKMSWKRKLGLCILMGGGFIAAVAGILKTVYIEDVAMSSNHTRTLVPLLASASSEVWLVIILGSAPHLRIVYNLVRASRSRSSTPSYEYSSDSKPSQGKAERQPDPYSLGLSTFGGESFVTDVRTDSQAGLVPGTRQQINVMTDYEVSYDKGRMNSEGTGQSMHSSQDSEVLK